MAGNSKSSKTHNNYATTQTIFFIKNVNKNDNIAIFLVILQHFYVKIRTYTLDYQAFRCFYLEG